MASGKNAVLFYIKTLNDDANESGLTWKKFLMFMVIVSRSVSKTSGTKMVSSTTVFLSG